jgi:hypothetical protein
MSGPTSQDAARRARLLAALRQAPEGLNRSHVQAVVFKNALRKAELDRLYAAMAREGLLTLERTRRQYVVEHTAEVVVPTIKALLDPRD